MTDTRCPVCGQSRRKIPGKCSENVVALGRYVGDEREKALEDAAKMVLMNRGKCVTDASCKALAEEIRNLKERK